MNIFVNKLEAETVTTTPQLVLRPRPAEGEHIDSYLRRVLVSNGFATLRGLVEMPQQRESKLQFLSSYVGLSSRELDLLVDPEYKVAESKEDRKLFLTSKVRWCGECLKERPVFLGAWVYRTTVACTRHRCWLRDECPRCHLPLTVSSCPDKCSCGFVFSEAHGAAATEELLHLQQALSKSFLGECVGKVFGLTYFQAAKFVHYAGVLACGSGKQSLQESALSRRVFNDLTLMKSGAHVLENWPQNFETLLALRQTVPSTQSVRRDFGTVYEVLYRCLKGSEYQFVRDAFERFVNSHWKGTLTRRNVAFSKKTLAGHPRVTLGKAAAKLGTSPSVLRRLGATVGMSEVGRERGRKCATVEVGRLPRVRGVTLQEAARLLHLPRRRVRMLLAAGLIKADISPARSRSAAWFISREQLKRLMPLTIVCETDDVVTFGHVIKYSRLSNEEFLSLVGQLVAGRLSPSSDAGGAVPIGSVKLARSALGEWREQFQRDNHRPYSVDGAARQLGIKQQVAYHLVRTGLLGSVPSRDGRSVQVRSSDLQLFKNEYVSLVALAKERGTVSKVLHALLPCSPVTGPDIDGGRQYFYRRGDLNEWICIGGDHNGR